MNSSNGRRGMGFYGKLDRLIADQERELNSLRQYTSLEQLIAEKERDLGSMQRVREMMHGKAIEKKQQSESALGAALEQERTRRERPKNHTTKADRRAVREQSAAFLAQFDRHTPGRPPANAKAFGIYITRGYLKKTKDGLYLRTAKPYVVEQA